MRNVVSAIRYLDAYLKGYFGYKIRTDQTTLIVAPGLKCTYFGCTT